MQESLWCDLVAYELHELSGQPNTCVSTRICQSVPVPVPKNNIQYIPVAEVRGRGFGPGREGGRYRMIIRSGPCLQISKIQIFAAVGRVIREGPYLVKGIGKQ